MRHDTLLNCIVQGLSKVYVQDTSSRLLEKNPIYTFSLVELDWRAQPGKYLLQLYLRSFYTVVPKSAEAIDDPFHTSTKSGYEHVVSGVVQVPKEVLDWNGDFNEDFTELLAELTEKYREVCVSMAFEEHKWLMRQVKRQKLRKRIRW